MILHLRSIAQVASLLVTSLAFALPAAAQIAPSAAELQAYQGLHAAAAKGDVAEIEKLVQRSCSPSTPAMDTAVRHFMSPPSCARMMRRAR